MAMRAIVRPLPVLYACQGCAAFGQAAREAGAILDRNGVAELVWLGAAPDLSRRSRFPIIALDGCGQACALRWLEGHGITPERSYLLEGRAPGSVEEAVRRMTADLG
jgi:uncharacterized metal-binding protein